MDVYSIIPITTYRYISFYKAVAAYIPDGGNGSFSSTFPEHIVSVEGVPAIGEIRILLRKGYAGFGDGVLVATTNTTISGEWRIDGLNPDYYYDVVCRVDGYNDLIFSNIQPKV